MGRLLACTLAALPLLAAALLARAGDASTEAGLASAAPPSGASDGGPPASGYQPDPSPLVTRRQWVLDLAYREGDVTLRAARTIALPRATATPRVMGRFALELYVGPVLLDRVRFDFPLLGAGELAESPRRWDSPPSFERHLSSSAAVMIPQSERTTRVMLVDRASGRSWVFPVPFETSDAGVVLPAKSSK